MNTNLYFEVSKTAPQRFRGIAYSGGLIPAYGRYGDAAIDLDTLELPSGKLFALVDHDPQKRAGQFTASREGQQIIVEGKLFESTDAGREVAALLEEGAPWQMSVGIQAKADEVSGEQEVNGQTLALNTIFRSAALREVSFVPVGADPNTSVAAFERQKPEDDLVEIEELKTQLAEAQSALQAAREELGAIKAKARDDAIADLAAKIGQEFQAEEREALASLDDAAFLSMSGAMLRFKPVVPEHLFHEQAVDGKSKDSDEREALKLARNLLIDQVSGKV